MDAAISINDVSKRFRIYHERNQSLKIALMRGRRANFEEFWALKDIDLEIPTGRTFGLIGHNGSGKSTLLKILARILVADTGSVVSTGRISALLELGAGFHPELSGRDNVYLNGSILGLSKRDIDSRFDEIVGFAGLERFIDTPVKNYSSGMYVRLGFSVAINVEPDILLVDEVLAVGDQEFQDRSMGKFDQFRKEGRTIVVVSHALGTMRSMCDEVAWLDHGRVLGVGSPDEIVDRYAGGADQVEAVVAEPADLRVTDASVIVDGVAMESVDSGAEVVFRVGWQARREIVAPSFHLVVTTADGVAVASSASSVGRTEGVGALGAGDGYVDLLVPRLPVHPGSYRLAVSVEDDETGRVYDRQDSAAQFSVHPSGGADGSGLVPLEGAWRTAVQR